MNQLNGIPENIQEALDRGMGCVSWIPERWIPIVVELHEKISEQYPDYALDQVKEKFGGLRYYVSPPLHYYADEEKYDNFNHYVSPLIEEAEIKVYELEKSL